MIRRFYRRINVDIWSNHRMRYFRGMSRCAHGEDIGIYCVEGREASAGQSSHMRNYLPFLIFIDLRIHCEEAEIYSWEVWARDQVTRCERLARTFKHSHTRQATSTSNIRLQVRNSLASNRSPPQGSTTFVGRPMGQQLEISCTNIPDQCTLFPFLHLIHIWSYFLFYFSNFYISIPGFIIGLGLAKCRRWARSGFH